MPPDGAPNVVVVLIDDVGFGASSAFGGPVQHAGLREGRGARSQVHPLPHDGPVLAHAGGAAPAATTTPSGWAASPNCDQRPRLQLTAAQHCAPLAETLKLNGYNTAQFGKCHEVPAWEATPVGPFDHWPHPGVASSTSTASSAARPTSGIRRSTRTPSARTVGHPRAGLPLHGRHDRHGDRLDPPAEVPGTRQAVLHVLRSGSDPRPAPRAERMGRQVPGQFDQGWDTLREETFARQKELGVVPETPSSPPAARASPPGTR